MECKQATLENGLDIIAEVNPAAESLAAGFFVRTGSRDETADISGVSHFLEHMVFKGTPKRSAMEVNLDFDRMGANYNAFTSEENTVYYASVLPEFQPQMLDLLCDILRPSLREEDFNMEKNVILDEIALYEDRPHFRLYDNLMNRHFADHPLGQSILGSPESIQALQRQAMQEYFNSRYSPTNLTLVAVGNVDFAALEAQARELCGAWTAYDVNRQTPGCDGSGRREAMVDPKLARQNIGLMNPAPSYQDDARDAASLLATILGDTTGSRLYYALVDPGLADEVHSSYLPLDQTGAIMTYLSTDPDRGAEVLAIVEDQFRTLLEDGITREELEAAKNKIASHTTIKGELPMGRLAAVGFDWIYRRTYEPMQEQIDRLFAVSAEAVMDVARTSLTSSTVLTLGPREEFTP